MSCMCWEISRMIVEVLARAVALGDAGEGLEQALPADAAGDAFAARFGGGEPEEVAGQLDHAGVVVHDDHAAANPSRRRLPGANRNPRAYSANWRAGSRPAGPPVCTALKCLPPGMPPPMSKTMSPSGMPMGTSTRPVLLILPVSAKIAVPGDLGAADVREPFGAVQDDLRGHGVALDVVDVGGLAPEPGDGGEGRSRTRFAAAAFDGGNQRGFFAADESAGAALDVDFETERCAEDILSQEAMLRGLGDGDLQPGDGQRIFLAAINECLRGTPSRRRRWSCPRSRCAGRSPGSNGP